jgi:hypothetical protein
LILREVTQRQQFPGDTVALAKLGLNLLERRLVESRTAVIIPFNDRVVFVSLLNCAKFSSGCSEVPQTLDAIS